VFAALSPEELKIVEAFIESQSELNITPIAEHTRLDENIIYWIEWFYPNKQSVLEYLDHDGPVPERAARVIIYRGSYPDVVEYKVMYISNMVLIIGRPITKSYILRRGSLPSRVR
jgi:hypothetical protein